MRQTLSRHIIDTLKARGVRRIFGIPGGGSSLSLIEDAARCGIEFVLARTETAAAIMAAATAELDGTPGVVLTGIGPGAASVVNGIAYASLEKSPLLLITDCMHSASSPHQVFDQQAVFAPLCKATARLTPANAGELDVLLDTCLAAPFGPVHIDLSATDASATVDTISTPGTAATRPAGNLEPARQLLNNARMPVVLVGLDARSTDAQAFARQLVGALGCPTLCTYKAKGIIADADPHCIGLFTNAAAEADVLSRADLIITVGLDPIEMIPQAWRPAAPVLELALAPGHRFPFTPAATVLAPAADLARDLLPGIAASDWTAADIKSARMAMRGKLALGEATLNAQTITETLAHLAPPSTRLCVDAGAHMFAAMAFWQADGHTTVLKSNGLSTMGYALPAGIACALHEPGAPVVCITGDGGMSMCLGELATAANLATPLVCVVLNDASLSLIDIKQQRTQNRPLGTRYDPVDFAAIAAGFGVRSCKVRTMDELRSAAASAFAGTAPMLIDVETDASGYAAQLERLRG